MTDLFFSAAYAKVVGACLPDDAPTLTHGDGITPDTEQEVDRIIITAQRATIWSAGLPVRVGQLIIPTVPNGIIYEVTNSGITGAVEPVWFTGYQPWFPTSRTVYDNGVIFRGYGDDSAGIYDVREACKQACLLKARRAAACVDFTADGVSIKNSQLRDFWLGEAKGYEAVCV
jgi:hypothetical protein